MLAGVQASLRRFAAWTPPARRLRQTAAEGRRKSRVFHHPTPDCSETNRPMAKPRLVWGPSRHDPWPSRPTQ